jgi:succinoglycan biosynthesis protein ExoV
MKLFYYKDPRGNFGDDLNPWLWEKLVPELLDDDPAEILVGIGTILDHRLPRSPIKHVLGSGVGYGNMPQVDERFIFHAVRGYATAAALGLPRNRVFTDAAVLVRRVVAVPSGAKHHDFGFMPTGHSEYHYDWEMLCRDLGFRFISCHWSVDRVIHEITHCRTLISEAMHGAIVADALRVPWIPVALDDSVLPFKWKDWLSTLDLPYEPTLVTSLCDNSRILGSSGRMKNVFKHLLKARGIWSFRWGSPFPLSSDSSARKRAMDQLHALTSKTPYLSDDNLIESLTVKYEDLIQKLKKSRRMF